MPKENKANHATKEARTNKVYELLVSGFNRYRIWQYVTSDEKAKVLFQSVSRRQLDRYIQEANGMLAAESEFVRPRELGRAIGALHDLYQRCMKGQDYNRALAVRSELNKLLGLHAPPPAQTIKLLGLDIDQLAVLTDAMQRHDLKPSEVFQIMLNKLAEQDKQKAQEAEEKKRAAG